MANIPDWVQTFCARGSKLIIWIIPGLYTFSVIGLGTFYAIFKIISNAEWQILRASATFTCASWILSAVTRIYFLIAQKRTGRVGDEIHRLEDQYKDDTPPIEVCERRYSLKKKRARLYKQAKKYGQVHIRLLRFSYAAIIFGLLYILFLEIF